MRRAFQTPELLQAKTDEYFLTDKGKTTPTLTGLCVHLGIHRDTWSAYGLGEIDSEEDIDGPDYSDIVKASRQRVEMVVEEKLLYGTQVTGAIFWLKNHAGYKDVKELAGSESQPLTVILSKGDQGLL